MLCSGPSAPRIVKQWSVQINLILNPVVRSFCPLHFETEGCCKIVDFTLTPAPCCMYLNIFFLNLFIFCKYMHTQDQYCPLDFFLDAVLRSLSRIVRLLTVLNNTFIVLLPLILRYTATILFFHKMIISIHMQFFLSEVLKVF